MDETTIVRSSGPRGDGSFLHRVSRGPDAVEFVLRRRPGTLLLEGDIVPGDGLAAEGHGEFCRALARSLVTTGKIDELGEESWELLELELDRRTLIRLMPEGPLSSPVPEPG